MNYDKKNTNTQTHSFKGHVLVVEDAPANQMLIKLLLQKLGLEVSIASNGKEGVEMATNQEFSLVFMDMQMPIMNGYDATTKLREDGYSTPIIALTASSMEGDLEKCMQAGCDDFLSKPINRQLLASTIEKHLNHDSQTLDAKIDSLKQQIDNLNQICSTTDDQSSQNTQVTTTAVRINYADAIKCCGDDSIIQRTAISILEDTPNNIKIIEKAIAEQNAKDTMIYSHKLKGVCLIIGAKQLASAAEQLETAALNNDLNNASTMLETINAEFDKLKTFLSQPDWIEKTKTAQQSEFS